MNSHRFSPQDKMCDVVSQHSTTLQVLSRFEIPLGFGDASIEVICNQNNIDTNTFLEILSFMSSPNQFRSDFTDTDIRTLLLYLQQAHSYFLNFSLPLIRQKLLQAIDCSKQNKIAFLILQFFDEYANEVSKHMEYENIHVFPYIKRLLATGNKGERMINQFSHLHSRNDSELESKLAELKNIIIKYYPGGTHNNLLISALLDIYSFEQEMTMHCKLEDYMLIPAVMKIEEMS